MAGITSLLKSAQATQKKIRGQEDAYVAFQWENSAQTYSDFQEYSKYLNGRIEKSDPSDALSYQTKLRSANRSYTSNEIQRQQMAIMEGRGDTSTKMQSIQGLWQRAIDTGDYNLAQNLGSQWDSLNIKMQNEQEAAMKAFQSANAASGGKAYSDLTKQLTKGVSDVTLPTGQVVTPLGALQRNFEETGDSVGVLKAAQETMAALRETVIDQYNNATTQDQRDKLEQEYGVELADMDKELTVNIGGKKLTAQDVVNAVANDSFNNPVYGLQATRNDVTGKNEFKLKENNVSQLDYERQIDPNTGEEFYTPLQVRTDQNDLFFGTSDQTRGLNTQITNEGSVIGGGVKGDNYKGNINMGTQQVERRDDQSIGNRLKQLGIIAKQNGTTLTIKLPGENVERVATIQPDGSIRYQDDNGQMAEFGLTKRNLGTDAAPMIYEPGQTRIVSADETSDFSKQSAFGGNISQASAQGKRYTQSITGQTNVNSLIPGGSGIGVSNNFAGYGGPATAGAFQGSSMLLQGASATRQVILQKQEQQRLQQAQAQLQASQNQFNLNQTPVQQLADNGVLKRQLSVAAPQAPRRVYVAPLPYTPIKSVGVAPRTQNISSVGVATNLPRIRL